MTVALGYLLARPHPLDWRVLLAAMFGTALVGGGANGLNQWWEAGADRLMRRTQGRPLPSGRVSPRAGLVFSATLTVLGLAVLLLWVNPLTAGLGILSWGVYLFAYTPLKKRTTLNTLVGACSGAIPPAMGWSAAAGRLDAGAWVLFAILFVWQIPHFLAIAWIHRRDYDAGGFRMLPVSDADGRTTFRIVVLYCVGLFPVAYSAVLIGLTGWIYLIGSTLLGAAMLREGIRAHRTRSDASARRLFRASLAYLPALLLLMLLDPTRVRAPF